MWRLCGILPAVTPITRGTTRRAWFVAAALLMAVGLFGARAILDGAPQAASAGHPPAARAFAARVERLSEPSGYFDTDNLISNEASYLHVMPGLAERGVTGGVYIGVGPDQNFSYIARIRPAAAYLVDIRRDNLLMHLLFKALFTLAPTRVDYLSLLTGRAAPPESLRIRDLALPEVLQWADKAARTDRAVLRATVETELRKSGVPLTAADLATIAKFHDEFIADGLALQFHSHGREPNAYYPTLRQLLMATDRAGRRWSYLDAETSYAYVRGMHQRDAIVPVVGDLSGPQALRAIGDEMRAGGQSLSAIYVSNVEDYLFRGRRFGRWVSNLAQLPHAANAVVIRSVFGGGPSISETQRVDDLTAGFNAGRFQNYADLVYRPR